MRRPKEIRDEENRRARAIECPLCGARPDHLCFATRGKRKGRQVGYHAQRINASQPIGDLIDRSSIGKGLRNIRENGIEAELAELDHEMGGRRQ